MKNSFAIVAQLVARHLAKVEAAGSNPVYRLQDIRKGVLFVSYELFEHYISVCYNLINLKKGAIYGQVKK